MFDIDMPEFEALQDALDGVANIDADQMSDGQVHRDRLRRSRWIVYDDDPIRQIPCRKPPPRDEIPKRSAARTNTTSP